MKSTRTFAFLVLFVFARRTGTGQTQIDSTLHIKPKISAAHRKNQFYFYWGYNRDWFSKSDLHMSGPVYDFTLNDIVATDRPSKFNFHDYFSPTRISIPQFNVRLGYYLTDNVSVSLGYDHMKYVMVQNQIVEINGSINDTSNSEYSGVYENELINLNTHFLRFEHTDGLNAATAEIDYSLHLLDLFKNDFLIINLNSGAGFGCMIPRSDVAVFDQRCNNKFHIAGYVLTIKSGVEINVWKYFFMRSDIKTGYINMSDILVYKDAPERAAQHFYFLESATVVGARFNF